MWETPSGVTREGYTSQYVCSPRIHSTHFGSSSKSLPNPNNSCNGFLFPRLWFWTMALCCNCIRCENGFNMTAIALVRVEGESAIGETDHDFICATLDWWPPEKCDYGTCSWGHASILNLDLENPLLATAVKAFRPLKIRLGGSLQDRVIYEVGKLKQPCHPFVKNSSMMFGFSDGCLPMSRWDALNAFFNKTGAVVAFGINALNGKRLMSDGATEGAWDSSNARDFIQYTVDHGHKIKAWELGNELSGNRISVEQYASDVIEFHGILGDIYKDCEEKPLLVAPDGSFVADWFKEFLQLTGPNILNVVTHHFYNLGAGVDKDLVEKILNPSYLSHEASTFKGLQAVLQNYGSWSNAWVGESGGAYNSGHNLVTNAFVMSFWYLDELGMSSAFNTKSFCRQSLIGGNYGLLNTTTFVPNPDYYSALLWHRLMGTRVLAANSTGTEYLRAYAHCAKNARGVTLLLINLSRDTGISVHVSTGSGTSTDGNSKLEYHLTAKEGDLHSQTVRLNGNILEITPDGEIPSLPGVIVPAEKPILVAPLSIAFVQLPYVQFTACS